MAKRVVGKNERAHIEPLPGPIKDLEKRSLRLCAIRVPADAGSCGAGQAEAVDQLLGPVSRGCIAGQPRRIAAPQLASAEHEIQRQNRVGQGNHAQYPGDGDRGRAPLARTARCQDIDQDADDDRQRMQRKGRKPGECGVQQDVGAGFRGGSRT